jgi:DNA repair protein RecN (Recombination protein N)
MLKQLFIQNYSLIESLDISFEQGLTVITGETGAGKSIILGAISLLLGQRADSKSLFDAEKKCIIEGSFNVDQHPTLPALFDELSLDFEPICTIRREINPQGKSRSFINDTPVNLEALKEIGLELVDIHSQQDTWWMSQPEFLLNMVDAYAGNAPILQAYQTAYKTYQTKLQLVEQLERTLEKGIENQDYLQFQLDELLAAKLQAQELQELEQTIQKLSHAEQIHEKLIQMAQLISESEVSGLDQIKAALQQAQAIARWSEEYEGWKNRIESIWIELKDLGLEISAEAESFQSDPQVLETAQKRYDVLQRLLQKHRKQTIEELISVRDSLDADLQGMNHSDETLKQAKIALNEAVTQANVLAKQLSDSRKACFEPIQKELTATMQQVGMENVQFSWELEEKGLSNNGTDKVQLLFSANKGTAPKPFKQIASGGELSRLMLAIKALLANKKNMPTLILDEIDTGVSGEVAFKMAEILKKMSVGHQLMAITHLYQIAAAGKKQFFVYKDHLGARTISRIKELSEAERIDEIAKMIGGNDGYEALKENVKQLLK